jgi:hypothetical protein
MNFKERQKEAPHLNEFFVRGVALDVALAARVQWATLSELERQALGFSASQEAQAISFGGYLERRVSRLN